MIQTSKTAQILARYRPIAPKPPDHHELITENNSNISNPNSDSPGMSQKIRDSPYLKSVWPNLQARPNRTRKRGRTSTLPSFKNSKPTYAFSPYLSPKNLSFLASPNVKDLDELNKQVPVEKDLLQQLQADQAPRIVIPRPIRLVSSAIIVQPQTTILNPAVVVQGPAKPEEIEEEMESETLPIVISDSNNKVRLANSAYNKLVGQPECCWLDSVAGCGGEAVTCNRICGEVMLQLPESAFQELVSSSSNGFFFLVVIEWGNSECKSSITTTCEAVRLFCESRDYMFAWRFHIQGAVVTSAPNF